MNYLLTVFASTANVLAMILYPAFLPILSISTTEDEAIMLNPMIVIRVAIVKIAALDFNFNSFSYINFHFLFI